MSGKRVLFFGVTGVEKKSALGQLAAWVKRHKVRSRPKVVDFEAEYLFNELRGGRKWYDFLDDTQHSQRKLWLQAWEAFLSDLNGIAADQDVFVSMHGCIVRGYYGVRSVIDPTRIARELRPDLIVSLLDDVYDMWWRTEKRAHDQPWAGMPTLEQLLFARRAELIMADQVALSPEDPIPNFVLAVGHPCETLSNRIYSPNPTVVYLCFPISAPRDLESVRDLSGKDEVTDFLRRAYERQRANPDLVFVCPLAIDELPLLAALDDETCHEFAERPESKEPVPVVVFDRDARRWSLTPPWNAAECLTPGPPGIEDRKPIPESQLRDARGMINTDVGWRDYRLVAQAKDGCVAAFNPKFKNRKNISRSVLEEIRDASTFCPVHVFQDRKVHDPDGVLDLHYPTGGTMQPGRGTQRVRTEYKNVEEVLDAVEELARRRSQ